MKKLSRLLFGLMALVTLGAISYAQVPGVNSTLNSVFTLVYEPATAKASFSATGTITTASLATDIFELVGSASKTVKIRKVRINGAATTAANAPIILVKRATKDDGNAIVNAGTITIATWDALSPTGQLAPTAGIDVYTANPTETTTAQQIIAEALVGLGNFSTTQPQTLDFTWGYYGGAPVLRGVAQSLAINLGGTTFTGGQITYYVEWTEE